MFSKETEFTMYHHYDLKKAYTTYDECKYYSGFPTDLSYCVSLTDMEFDKVSNIIDTNEGFIMVIMKCLWTGNQVTRWVSFPYYRYYINERDDPITPLYAMIGNNTSDLDISDLQVTKRMWHCVMGYLNRTVKYDSYITTDPLLAKTGKGSVEEHNGVYRKSSYYTSVGSKYYPHISGYVQNYTEIRLERFVINQKIKTDNIIRVWIDGIYVKGNKKLAWVNSRTTPDLCNNAWHYKTDATEQTEDIIQTYTAIEPVYHGAKFTNKVINLSNTIIKGVGGTGKSTLLRSLYDQTPNSIILTPTNELKKQYPKCKVETLDTLITNPYLYKRYNTMLIDEYTMISQNKLDKLNIMFPNTRLILSGDIGQLGTYSGDDINEEKFDIIILTKNYRQHNIKFQKVVM
jgi:hypothetical protein